MEFEYFFRLLVVLMYKEEAKMLTFSLASDEKNALATFEVRCKREFETLLPHCRAVEAACMCFHAQNASLKKKKKSFLCAEGSGLQQVRVSSSAQ